MFALVVFQEGKTSIRRITKYTDKDLAIEKYGKFKSESYCELWYTRYPYLAHKEIKRIAKLEGSDKLVEVEYALISQSPSYERILPFKKWYVEE